MEFTIRATNTRTSYSYIVVFLLTLYRIPSTMIFFSLFKQLNVFHLKPLCENWILFYSTERKLVRVMKQLIAKAVAQRCFVKKVKFTEKDLCQSLFVNKVAGLYHIENSPLICSSNLHWSIWLRSSTLLKKRLWHSCFLVNFAKLLRTPFLIEQLRWLLL